MQERIYFSENTNGTQQLNKVAQNKNNDIKHKYLNIRNVFKRNNYYPQLFTNQTKKFSNEHNTQNI